MSKLKEIIQMIIQKMTIKVAAILVVSVVAVAVGLYFYLNDVQPTAARQMANTNNNQYLEETVRVDNIVVGILEAGSASLNTEAISLEYASTIAEVYAKPGQYVEVGDQLVLIDAQAQEEAIDLIRDELYTKQLSLEAALLSAQTKKMQAESTYNMQVFQGETAGTSFDLTTAELDAQLKQYDRNVTELGIQHAEVETQRGALSSKYNISGLESNVSSANSALVTAEAALAAENASPTGLVIADLEADVDNAKQTLSSAQSALSNAQSNMESEYTQLTNQMAGYVEDIAKQQTEKESYYLTYQSQLMSVNSDYKTEVYEYETAEATYNNTIAQIENDIASAQKSVDDLLEQIEDYQEVTNLVVAPVAGYIMSQSEVGSNLNAGGTITTIADNTESNIYVSISQEDIAEIYVGMETDIVFDAYDDIEVNGVVDAISLTPSSGMASSVSYTVTIVCDLTPYEGVVVFEGMTTTVTFIQKQKENVLVVSSKCITNENGKQYVKIVNDLGEIEPIEVTTGFSDGFDVEIVAGVEEGDIVIIESVVM